MSADQNGEAEMNDVDGGIKQCRKDFAPGPAQEIAKRVGRMRMGRDPLDTSVEVDLGHRVSGKGVTTRAVWYQTPETLTGVVCECEESFTGIALARGLALREGDRTLILVLPEDWAWPTLQRLPWLTPDPAPGVMPTVEVYTYDHDFLPALAPTRSRRQTQRGAGGTTSAHDLYLGEAGKTVRSLADWATQNEDLDPCHRWNVRAWSCRGQRVLRIHQNNGGVEIVAGIDAKHDPAPHFVVHVELDNTTLREIRAGVELGISHAMNKDFGAFEEHHLQAILRRHPDSLGLELPVLREVPAWRPKGPGKGKTAGKTRGRGYIDLVATDGLGDITIVETKLAGDDQLVLQGLDYWMWASRGRNFEWLRQRLHADPQASLRLLYAVGGKGGATPKLCKQALAQLDALHHEVNWSIALIRDWTEGKPQVELLPPRTKP